MYFSSSQLWYYPITTAIAVRLSHSSRNARDRICDGPTNGIRLRSRSQELSPRACLRPVYLAGHENELPILSKPSGAYCNNVRYRKRSRNGVSRLHALERLAKRIQRVVDKVMSRRKYCSRVGSTTLAPVGPD